MAKSEKVPKQMKPRFDSIVALTDAFCKDHLNEEYAQLARQAAAALSRKRPSPLQRGKAESWACGIVYALGSMNFLFDRSFEPYISASDLCKGFGVGASTGSARSREVRDALNMGPLSVDWSLPSMLEDNPLVWMLQVNGIIVDARDMPRDIQEMAYEHGFIPYMPAEGSEGKEDQEEVTGSPSTIYQIRVDLEDIKPPIWRRLQVPSDITLHQLHLVLQIAIGWTNSHLYQFIIGGVCYGEPHPDFGYEMKDARRTRLSQVARGEGSKLAYQYDFGDNWEHAIIVEKVLPAEEGKQYPVCTAGRRACPPEDCGGVFGYAELLEIIQDPEHEDHEEMMEWLADGFDPEAFDRDEVNQALAAVAR